MCHVHLTAIIWRVTARNGLRVQARTWPGLSYVCHIHLTAVIWCATASNVTTSAKREHLQRVYGLIPESAGQNLALTVLYVRYSRDSGDLACQREQLPSGTRSRKTTGVHPTPCTLHPAPYILHPTPSTLHPAPCTLEEHVERKS